MDKIKFKHNKKRNVLFLYEALVRTLTKAIVDGDKEGKAASLAILKEFFRKGTILYSEVTLYRALNETYGLKRETAARLLDEVLRVYSTFDQGEMKEKHDQLVSRINRDVPKKLYSTFVPNYRNLATVYQLFRGKGKLSPANKVLLEEKIIEQLMIESPEAAASVQLESIDNLAFKMFVRSFNEHCAPLLAEQRELLQRYILASGDSFDFRAFLNEEIGRIREKLPNLLKVKEIVEDPVMLERAQQLPSVLDRFREEKEVSPTMLETLLRVQQLISEAQSDAK